MDMVKNLAYEMQKEDKPKSRILRNVFYKAIGWGQNKAFEVEHREYYTNHQFFNSFTTGYGIKEVK